MWFLKPLAIALLGLPVTLLGFILVPMGFVFGFRTAREMQPFTQYPERGEWFLCRLPKLLLPWDNVYDGFLGDKRGWWANECALKGRHYTDYLSMWLWGAVRNPANYWSRHITGLDISKCAIRKLSGNCDLPSEEPGKREWVHLRAYHANGKTYDRFFLSWAVTQDHGIMVDIGWKFKLEHGGMAEDAPEKDRIRGSVFTLSPWKKLT